MFKNWTIITLAQPIPAKIITSHVFSSNVNFGSIPNNNLLFPRPWNKIRTNFEFYFSIEITKIRKTERLN